MWLLGRLALHGSVLWSALLCPVLAYRTVLTPGYREWGYLARASNPFCANAPLYVVNNLKLAGLLAVAILGARLAPLMEA